MLAWLLLLPGLGRFVQLVVDAVGGGPLAEPLGVVAVKGRTGGVDIRSVGSRVRSS